MTLNIHYIPVLVHVYISLSRIPDLSLEEEDEWSVLLRVLTEFCDCSLEQSVSRELVEARDEEQMARVSHTALRVVFSSVCK